MVGSLNSRRSLKTCINAHLRAAGCTLSLRALQYMFKAFAAYLCAMFTVATLRCLFVRQHVSEMLEYLSITVKCFDADAFGFIAVFKLAFCAFAPAYLGAIVVAWFVGVLDVEDMRRLRACS